MSERLRPTPVDDESKELFTKAQEAIELGPEAVAALLAESEPEMVVALLHQIEDQELLTDPKLQESLRQVRAGELVDITPNPEAVAEDLMDQVQQAKEGPNIIEGPH